MRAFIIRPFGTRKGINFDEVEEKLLGPALQRVGAEGRTTGEILQAGNIRMDMFQELLVADLVIADITTNNPNAFYELGIRHALQEKRTFLIRAKLPGAQTAEEAKEADVPFDLKTDRYFEYDPGRPGDSAAILADALQSTVTSERQDSPVFLSLPNLRPQQREQFIPVPLGFGEEVQRAEKGHDPRKLTLLALEAKGARWESAGFRVAGRALMLINSYGAAKTAWENVRANDPLDFEANLNLGNIYQRLDQMTDSDLALERALERATEPEQWAEIHGQLGRNRKDRWVKSWTDAPASEKPKLALDSPLLLDAYQQYLMAYRYDLDSYYPGLNALALAIVIGELAGRFADVWESKFADTDEAAARLKEIERKREQIAAALQLRFEDADDPEAGSRDPWLVVSAADLCLMTSPNARRALQFYKKAVTDQGPFILDAARRQLLLFAQLGILQANANEALQAFPPDADRAKEQRLDRLVLFAGHRLDSTNRKTPRFPASKETVARNAIRAALAEEKAAANGAMLGVSGAANGGDLLFLESCDELGMPTEMMLALPEGPYIQASVDCEDNGWVRRFDKQMQKHSNTPVLSETAELPGWLHFKKGYGIWQRNNLWLLSEALCRAPRHLTLIALWDGLGGDGPGGTEDMVRLAKERGARIVHLDTAKLFGFSEAARAR